METKKIVLSKAILESLRTVGASCANAEFGVVNSIRFAGDAIIEKVELKPNDVLDHEVWMATRDSIEAGYVMQYFKNRDIKTPTDDERSRASSAAAKAADKIRAYLIDYGVAIKKSESPEAEKKRKQREKAAQELTALDHRILKEVKVRSERQGIDEMLAALEIAQGNPVKMQKILAAIDRAHKKENKAQAAAEAEEIKNLKNEVRAKVRTADSDTLKAMLAC